MNKLSGILYLEARGGQFWVEVESVALPRLSDSESRGFFPNGIGISWVLGCRNPDGYWDMFSKIILGVTSDCKTPPALNHNPSAALSGILCELCG